MIRGMFSAISGLKEHQVMLDVTANNLANVNTVGYKGSRTTFKDQLEQNVSGGSASSAATGGQNAQQIGLGVSLGSVDNMLTSGSLQTTGNPLDVAISGEGWFRIGQGAPPALPTSVSYTRAGNFSRNDQGYLVNGEGYYVVGRNPSATTDSYIQIPAGASGVTVGNDGSVSYVPSGSATRTTAGTISVARFPNENGLVRASGNRWIADPAAGAPIIGQPGGTNGFTVGGAVEMSNVDLANEFTNMIIAQRGFQASSRVISTSDQILEDLVNLKR